ncbi:MAG: MaoC family dehydratase [Candidatus Thorarchaeota archaeon]
MEVKSYEDIEIGQKDSLTHTITTEDIELFGKLSGDYNPVHFNDEFAKKTIFKGRIAHGLLSGAFISTLLANKLPGPGSVYLKQEFIFKKPVKIGDKITVQAEVVNKFDDKKHILLKTYCTNQNGEIVLDGEALVTIMRLET